jgi:hypothetical protein
MSLVIERDLDPDRMALARRLLFERRRVHGGAFIDLDDAAAAIAEAFEHGRRFGVAKVVRTRVCRVCGCTEFDPCRDALPCAWVGPDLCDLCKPFTESLTEPLV